MLCRSAIVCSAVAGPIVAGRDAAADHLPAPQGDVVLTVTGNIAHTNAPGAMQFDMAMLAALPQTTFETSTIWTEGMVRFAGIPLRALLDAVGAEGAMLTVYAINDYSATIPVDTIAPLSPILATTRDGAPMSVRDKGPIWIVYPYDSDPAFQTETVYARSVWQVVRVDVGD